jgi:hypothetical protein
MWAVVLKLLCIWDPCKHLQDLPKSSVDVTQGDAALPDICQLLLLLLLLLCLLRHALPPFTCCRSANFKVTGVGIEDLAIEFPWTPYMGHHEGERHVEHLLNPVNTRTIQACLHVIKLFTHTLLGCCDRRWLQLLNEDTATPDPDPA